MRTKDDHIGVLSSRRGHDRFDGITFPDEECRPCASCPSSSHEGLGRGLDAGALLVDSLDEPTARQAQTLGVHDAEDDELGAMLGGELDRLVGGTV